MVNATKAKHRAAAVRRELAQMDHCVGLGLEDLVLARLVARIFRAAGVDESRAAGLAADALQLVPRPPWVSTIAGEHPDCAPALKA